MTPVFDAGSRPLVYNWSSEWGFMTGRDATKTRKITPWNSIWDAQI